MFRTRSLKGAALVAMLARHYGAEVLLLKGEEVSIEELTSMAGEKVEWIGLLRIILVWRFVLPRYVWAFI